MNNDTSWISNKTAFILAFAALLVGFSGVSTSLQNIPVILGFRSSNLWEVAIFSFSLLFLSIYLYALDSVRYGIKYIEGWKVFKYVQSLANIIYFLAIISPVAIFTIWLVVLILQSVPLVEAKNNIYIISTVVGSLLGVLLALVSLRFEQSKKNIIIDEINENAAELLYETSKLVKNRSWRMVVIESFRLLELVIKNKAIDLGIDSRRIPFIRIIRIFANKGIITQEQASKLDDIRGIRNLAVHSEENITKEQATFVINAINEITQKLAPPKFAASYIEDIAFSALTKLFPRHHIFPQFQINNNKRIDFKAEGPKYNYYIEVKASNDKPSIQNGIKQLQLFLENNNDRGLLIVNSSTEQILSNDPRIKILFLDTEKGKFINEKIIYDWIYAKS